MRPGVRDFDTFLRGAFAKKLTRAYENFEIFCEADLQFVACLLIRRYLKGFRNPNLRVLNKPYFQKLDVYPDLVVFRRNKPWLLIELKESSVLRQAAAVRDRDKLLKIGKLVSAVKEGYPKRAYLVWVGRRSSDYELPRSKRAARYFSEIKLALDSRRHPDWIREWRQKFRPWARYDPA